MAYEQTINRSDVKLALLDAEIRGLSLPGFAGIINRRGAIAAVFETEPTQVTLDSLQAAVAAHNPATLTQAEALQANRLAKRAEIVGEKAQAALDSLNADLATLDGGPTNAEIVAIVQRLAVRQRAVIQYLKAELER